MCGFSLPDLDMTQNESAEIKAVQVEEKAEEKEKQQKQNHQK